MMKSNFLNLPSSAAGDARRHVPFRSIINKHFSVLFVLVFVFSILFSYVHPVAALADPVFQPVYDTQFYQLPEFVDPLNSTQQDIFYFILGSQVVEYAGLSDYQVENPYSDPSSVGEWFKKIGIDLYNDVLESFAIAGAPIIVGAKWVKDLYANIAGAANFAGAFNNSSWTDWYNDVQTNGLSLKLYPSMFGALNQFLANYGGLSEWQYHSSDFYDPHFVWNSVSVSASLSSTYGYYLNNLSSPYVPFNVYNNSTDRFSPYNIVSTNFVFNIFFDTSVNRFYLTDGYGNRFRFENIPTVFVNHDSEYAYTTNLVVNNTTYFEGSFNNSMSYQEYIYSILYNLSNTRILYLRYSAFNNGSDYVSYYVMPNVNNCFNKAFYGTDWNNKTEIFNTTDLNFDDNTNQDYLNPIIDTLLDIKGLINDLIEQNELKQPALDNLTDLNGDPLPASQLQPVSVAVELPDSGITINSGLFTPLTKDGGYINYLWYMTKPLVQYTSDFIQTLVFPDDTGEGFDATGPGVIVFGVICLGLIGGLVVKCLL